MGLFSNGLYDGYGTLTQGNIMYEGDFQEGLFNGRGRITVKEVMIIEGTFAMGSINGAVQV